jgi:hypothetical protein
VKREAVRYLTTEEQFSNRKACKLIGISRTTCQYKAKQKDDSELQLALTEHSQISMLQSVIGNAVTVSGIKATLGITSAFTVFTRI